MNRVKDYNYLGYRVVIDIGLCPYPITDNLCHVVYHSDAIIPGAPEHFHVYLTPYRWQSIVEHDGIEQLVRGLKQPLQFKIQQGFAPHN